MPSESGWPLGEGRRLRPHQVTQVWVADIGTGSARLVHSTDALLLEAPNWAPDGEALILNGDGLLWRLGLGPDPQLTRIPIEGIPPVNNDHLVDAERGLLYLSANDGHIYRTPLDGGPATRITHDGDHFHFLHGLSPDGTTLAFVELPVDDHTAPGRLALVAATGGPTRYPQAGSGHIDGPGHVDGPGHIDGPEYSPDGAWLYLNTEAFAVRPGHAQLARIPATGGRLERLVASDTVDWFPHLSPDGSHATYVSFPPGTLGHPADLDVEVRLVSTSSWDDVLARFPLYGGQGTLNVNSWSPDSRRFAFVAYPVEQSEAQP